MSTSSGRFFELNTPVASGSESNRPQAANSR